ncbi:MAG: 23S rRNA (pseudouridine(1915)-N(3))-methyltransferase RlmH, partial [Spirochaetaceae bacterium]|nr:23S rRNA (pseudouridine(1915)-N(3))-methyltransferase RlmH [Spirochaetaceae bacterium]
MRITIIAAGKIRDKWINEGIAEYTKRLKRFGKLEIIEVRDEKVPEKYSAKEIAQAVNREGKKMLARWPSDAWGIAMYLGGDTPGSEGLADLLSRRAVAGTHHIVFAIGGSNGLSDEVLGKCRKKISFGPNTFPHQLFRVMLLEQIYRA